ncbi:universal stress protein [Pseudomonas sp. REP124]|uniref:universal stress protein n=1 Tax=Pseudomonas sp. REP124 TaxID=2875731 RepID=UPI001CD00DB7|nr:universal stress protein [Pseudomonas sp. REP124]MBZ9783671.1 universal stress protein [Pseudomonas sp. REP124]
MSQYQHLLLVVDPTLRHSSAINHAAALANASGASLHIAALVPSFKWLSLLEEGDREHAREGYLQDQRNWLQAQAEKLRGKGVEVTTEVVWADDMKQEILDHVAELQPDLLIKQNQYESLFNRVSFTPLDWHLLRRCPVPIFLVGGSGYVLPRKVVAAVEVTDSEAIDNELNERIIKQARSLAIQCDAQLHLIYAYDISAPFLAVMRGLSLTDLTRALRADMEKSFSRLAEQFAVPSNLRHFIEGSPANALSEFAHEHHVDVIVMGRVQSHGMDKLLGSTIEHILYQVPCCILAV